MLNQLIGLTLNQHKMCEFGKNMKSQFFQKLKEVEAIIIENNGQDYIKTQIRYSPRIGLSYNNFYFTIEVTIWEYRFAENYVIYLESWLDEKEVFFEIMVEKLSTLKSA